MSETASKWVDWFRDKILPWLVITLIGAAVKLYIDVHDLKNQIDHEQKQDERIDKLNVRQWRIVNYLRDLPQIPGVERFDPNKPTAWEVTGHEDAPAPAEANP